MTNCGCSFAAQSWPSSLLSGSGKHHCRICGDIFCGTCAPVREHIALPSFISIIDVPETSTTGVAATATSAAAAAAAAVGWDEQASGYRRWNPFLR